MRRTRRRALIMACRWSVLWAICLSSPAVGGLREAQAGGTDFESVSRAAALARDTGELTEAIDLYRTGTALDPQWAEGWWYLGTLHYDLDQYVEGRDAFRRYVRIEPEVSEGWALLGLCEFQTREYDRALVSLERAHALGLQMGSRIYPVATYHRALLLNRFEQFEFAIDALGKLALNSPNNPRVVEALGIAVLRLPFLPQELPPDRREAVVIAGEAANAWSTSRQSEAREGFDRLADRYPDLPHVHYARGVFYLVEDPDEALREFQRELEISPGHLPALLHLAFEHLKRGQPAAARPFAEDAVRLDPGSFAARNALGRVLLDQDEVEGAVRELERGVELASDSPQMYFSLARAYTKAGRREDARAAREEFLRLDQLRRERAVADTPNRAGRDILRQTRDDP